MKFRIKLSNGAETTLQNDPKWTKQVSDNQRRNFNHTFFKDTAVIAHHGVKGMQWGVHNEETKQKYGETGAGLEGGGGGMLQDEENEEGQEKEENMSEFDRDMARVEANPDLNTDLHRQMKEFEEDSGDHVLHQGGQGSGDGNMFDSQYYYYYSGEKGLLGRNKLKKIHRKAVEDGNFNGEYTILKNRDTGRTEYNDNTEKKEPVYESYEAGTTKKRKTSSVPYSKRNPGAEEDSKNRKVANWS